MTFSAQNLVAMHDRDRANYESERDAYAAKGYRTLSPSIYGAPEDPRYAAVMVLRPHVIETRSSAALNHAELMNTMNDMAEKQLYPYLVTATGPASGPLYAVAFRRMDETPLVLVDMDHAQFTFQNDAAHNEGMTLLWVDAFGTADDVHYCAVWASDPTRTAWNVDAVDEGGAVLQQRFDAMTSVGARPCLVAITPNGRLVEMFVDTEVGPWVSRVGLTSAAYQAEFDAQAAAGRWPVCVSASGAGADARFAAVFATGEETSPRVPRSTSLGPKVAAIDDATQAFLAAQHMRGASLAVVQGTRLVYASGYTNAETDYPDLLPSTMYRQASISKAFCATAVMRLVNQGKLGLGQPILPLLGLSTAEGVTAHVTPDHPDWSYESVTLWHLLASVSGIDQNWLYASDQAAGWAGQPLPSNPQQLARFIVSTVPMTGSPGDIHNCVYGNVDYLLLSLIVARAHGSDTFEEALRDLVLDPLGCDDTQGSTALLAEQPAGHARHHLSVYDHEEDHWWLNPLQCQQSIRSADRPLEPFQYGAQDYDTFDGCGGLSASVVDVARLCAMFANRTDNPLFTPPQLKAWFTKVVEATNKQLSPFFDKAGNRIAAHGYYGFDWAKSIDEATGAYKIAKGGWLPGTGTYFEGVTGGTIVIAAFNGNTRPHVSDTWFKDVTAAVVAQGSGWGAADLFAVPTSATPVTYSPELDSVAVASVPGPMEAAELMATLQMDMASDLQRHRGVERAVRRPVERLVVSPPRQPA